MNDPEEDDPSPYSVIQSSFNFTEPKKLTKVLFLTDYYKKIKAPNPRPHFNVVATTNQNLGQSNPKPQQLHLHENDPPPDNSSNRNCYSNHGT